MELKTKLLFAVVVLLVILSVATSYYRFIITNEYDRYYDDYGESELLEEETTSET